MSKHIFLTGDVQVGKSTVIQKVLSSFDGSVGGFRSAFDARRNEAERWLYLWDAAETPVPDEAYGVVRFTDRYRSEVFPDRFNELGGGALRRAKEKGVSLILMDECGRFEGSAEEFRREIFSALDGDIPILGVVRQGAHGWLDDLRAHPNVTVLTVTLDNRDTLPCEIKTLLGHSMHHKNLAPSFVCDTDASSVDKT